MQPFGAQHAAPEAANDDNRTRTPLRYLSAGCPEGWNTVWGYLALTNPGLIELMDKIPDVIAPDEEQLDQDCEMAGVAPLTVPACLWLQTHRISDSRAYPVELLAERLG